MVCTRFPKDSSCFPVVPACFPKVSSRFPVVPACFPEGFTEDGNGLRYPRWGGRRNAVRLEKC